MGGGEDEGGMVIGLGEDRVVGFLRRGFGM